MCCSSPWRTLAWGVPVEWHERIWEPFFTTKQRGTGLGLAIVRKRIEEIGGTASLVITNGTAGARFELRVPLASQELPKSYSASDEHDKFLGTTRA